MYPRARFSSAVQLLSLLALSSAVLAQDRDSVRVNVTDPEGLPIMGARVAGPEPTANNCVTDQSGNCTLPAAGLPAVDVTAAGFDPQHVEVSSGSVEARVTMRIKSRVDVEVNSSKLESPASVQGSMMSAEQVDRVPVWLRKLENIQPLFPGTVSRSTDDEWGEGLSAAGTRSTAMNTVLDGMPNRAERRGGPAIKPPLEAVSEFRVYTSGYSAEYGHTPGAQLVMVTKSGTDQIHGDFYNYARDRFGGMLGGPIQKGKSYYFASYERANTNFDSPVTSTVLTPAQLQGGAKSPLSQTLLPLVPVSSTGSVTYKGEHSVDSELIARLDRNIGDKSKLTARFAAGMGGQVLEPDSAVFLPRDWPSQDDRAYSGVVSFNRNQANRGFELRASFLDTLGDSTPSCHHDAQYSVTLAGGAATLGCPILDIAGYPLFGDIANLYNYRSQSADFGGSYFANIGRDSVKVGVAGKHLRYKGGNPSQENGYLLFDGSHYGSPVTDFLMGAPVTAIRDFGTTKRTGELMPSSVGGFVQNAFRIGESFIVDTGLRLEYLSSMTGHSPELTSFSPTLGVVENGSQKELLRGQGLVVDPRLGFSWRPFGGATVVRGGIGQYSGQDILSVVLEQLTNAPAPRAFVTSAPVHVVVDPKNPAWTPIDSSMVRGIDPQNRITRVYQYSLTVERELGAGASVEIAYIGSKGLHLGRLVNINMTLPNGAIDASGSPVMVRKYAGFGDIIYDDQGGYSSYNSGRIRFQQRTGGGGIDLNLSYTFSKSIDDSSSTENRNWTGLPYAQDPRNLNGERAVSDFNHKHQVSGYVIVLLDKYTKTAWLRRAEVSSSLNVMSGLPFSPISDSRYLYRADVVGDPYQNVPEGHFINPAAFKAHIPTAADPSYFGSAGRNSLSTPYFNTIDVAFNKGFKVKSRALIKVRVEVFNVLSRRVPYVNNVLSEPGFGTRSHFINEERHIVAGARLSF
jgi:hypothetical protein